MLDSGPAIGAHLPSTRRVPECLCCGIEGSLLYAGLADRLFGVPGTWGFRRCHRCGLMWLDPRPVPEAVSALYVNYFTHVLEARVPRNLNQAAKAAVLSASFGYSELSRHRWVGWVLSRSRLVRDAVGLSVRMLDGRRRGRLLDVGCGNGDFLAAMRDLGWSVSGIDFDREAVAVAREKLGLDVRVADLHAASFPDDSFDAVTLHHVLEHLEDPVGALRECARVLKPGGRLVVVTPNGQALGRRLFQALWFPLDPPRHIHLFSVKTLVWVALTAGLALESASTTAREARFVSIASLVLRRDGAVPGGVPRHAGWAVQALGAVFQVFEQAACHFGDVGEEVVMIATKRKGDARRGLG